MKKPDYTPVKEPPVIFTEGNKKGLKNSKGEVITPAEFDHIYPFTGQFTKARRGNLFTLIARDGVQVINLSSTSIITRPWGVYNKFIHVISSAKRKGFIIDGLLDFTGFIFDEIGDLFDGRAKITVSGKTGYIDEFGKFIVQPRYDRGTGFSTGYAIVGVGDISFAIDRWGDRIELKDHFSAHAYAAHKEFARIAVHKRLKTVTRPVPITRKWFISQTAWELYEALTPRKLFIGDHDDLLLLFDASGNLCCPPSSLGLLMLSPDRYIYRQETAEHPFEVNKCYGVGDISGRIILPPVFEEVNALEDNMFVIKLNGLYGVVDIAGRFLVPPTYNSPEDIPGIQINDLPESER